MNCRSAQRLLSAERDGALANERAALDSHLAECAECRQFRVVVADAAGAWRTSAARVQVPDADLAWQAVRREIRSNGAAAGARSAPWFSRWALPVGAAALVAAMVIIAPHWRQEPATVATTPSREVARADFVEVGGASSPMVYVDDKSGWLVVWAADEPHPKSG